MEVQAAVVRCFEQPPRYEPFTLPDAVDHEHSCVEVLAVGLHPRVRSSASGRHYTATCTLPMVPGVDGVGRGNDGRLVYFVADEKLVGPMATHTVIDLRRCIVLPDDANVAKIAAAMNPAMSSWVALRRRVPIEPGQSVLVLGATGNAGQMAVQIAKLLGADRVVGAGRDLVRLAELPGLGADATVAITADRAETAAALAEAACDVDLVIDYLWGEPASNAMMALLLARADRSRALNWIQIGSMAGPTIELPSVALRSANLCIRGNGQGAVSTAVYLAELPSLIDAINDGTIKVNVVAKLLSEVEKAWTTPESTGTRTVIRP